MLPDTTDRQKERERDSEEKKDMVEWVQVTDLPLQTVTYRRSETDCKKSWSKSDSADTDVRCESATKRMRSAATKQMSARLNFHPDWSGSSDVSLTQCGVLNVKLTYLAQQRDLRGD